MMKKTFWIPIFFTAIVAALGLTLVIASDDAGPAESVQLVAQDSPDSIIIPHPPIPISLDFDEDSDVIQGKEMFMVAVGLETRSPDTFGQGLVDIVADNPGFNLGILGMQIISGAGPIKDGEQTDVGLIFIGGPEIASP